MDLILTLKFVFFALCGGLSFILMVSDSWDDLTKFSSVRHVLISLLVGVIYYRLYSDYSFPNMVMSFVSGYMGPDFIERIVDKRQRMATRSP